MDIIEAALVCVLNQLHHYLSMRGTGDSMASALWRTFAAHIDHHLIPSLLEKAPFRISDIVAVQFCGEAEN